MEATLLIVNKWANPASFSFIFGLLKQTVQFLQRIYQKNTHRMPGFEPTTSRTWVVSYNHETNETFIPMTGTWRCSWEVDGKIEFFDVEQWDICSFPAGVQRRFENVTFSEPDKNHTLMFVIGGDAPEVDFSAKAKETLRSAGLLK